MKKNRLGHIYVFGTFFIFLLMQYQHVYLYYDDFGYCSLSYGYDAGIVGNDITIKSLLVWLIHSYSAVNGRIFTNFIFILTAWIGDVHLMRIFIPTCIVGILYLIYSDTLSKLKNEMQRTIGTILLVLSYGIFDIEICKDGLYWFAAAFGYVVPMLLFFLFLKIEKNKILKYFLTILLCLTCEQMVAMMFFYLVSNIIIFMGETKAVNRSYIKMLFLTLLGGMLMILSPASRNRLTASSENAAFNGFSFIEKVNASINSIIGDCFGKQRIIFCLFLLALFVITSVLILKSEYSKTFKSENVIYIFLTCIIFILCLKDSTDFMSKYIGWGLFVYVLLGFINIIALYYKLDSKKIPIIIAGMASIGLLLIMPEKPVRTFIPIAFIIIYLMMDVLSRLICEWRNINRIIIYIPMATMMIINMLVIYKGYAANAEVLNINESRLIETRRLLENGINVDEIQLYRLKNDVYAGAQVYQKESYMKWWMDEYYAIPRGVEYVFYDYATRDNGVSIWENNGAIVCTDRVPDVIEEAGSTLRSCVKQYGYFEDGWAGKSSQFLIKTRGKGEIDIELYCPLDDFTDSKIEIYVNDVLADTVSIRESVQFISVKAEPNQVVQLGLETNFAMIGSEEDQRELSILILSMRGQ